MKAAGKSGQSADKKDKVKEPKQEDFLRIDLDKEKDPKSYKGNDLGNHCLIIKS